MSPEIKPGRKTSADRILQRYIERVEDGDKTTIRRIQETLEIDSETKPTLDQIVAFVSLQVQERLRRPQSARRKK